MKKHRRKAYLFVLAALAASVLLAGCSGCVSPAVDEMLARQNAALESAHSISNQESVP